MTPIDLIILTLVGWGAATLGAIAGGATLVAVPIMIMVGLDAPTAVATNMFGMTFLCIGAAARFARSGTTSATSHDSAGRAGDSRRCHRRAAGGIHLQVHP